MKDIFELIKNEDRLTDFLITMKEDFNMLDRFDVQYQEFKKLWKDTINNPDDQRLSKLYHDAVDAFVNHGVKGEMNVESYTYEDTDKRTGRTYIRTSKKGLDYQVPLTELWILMYIDYKNRKNDSSFIMYPKKVTADPEYISLFDLNSKLEQKIDDKLQEIIDLQKFLKSIHSKKDQITKEIDKMMVDEKLADKYEEDSTPYLDFFKKNSGPLKLDKKLEVRMANIYSQFPKFKLQFYTNEQREKNKQIIMEKTGKQSFVKLNREFKRDKKKFSNKYGFTPDEACFLYDMFDILVHEEKQETKKELMLKSLRNFLKQLRKLVNNDDKIMMDIEKMKNDSIEVIHFFFKHYGVIADVLFEDVPNPEASYNFRTVYEDYNENSESVREYIERNFNVIDGRNLEAAKKAQEASNANNPFAALFGI